jgi:hypothetical protein
MPSFAIPDDPLARFQQIYAALSERRGWLEDATPFQFAAISLVTSPGDPEEIADNLRNLGEALKKRAGWFGDLRSATRFLVAASLLRAEESAETFCAAEEAASELFREQGLRRGSVYEVIAILILRQQNAHGIVQSHQVARFKTIYEMMKSYHWWLTGPDDYPACALLCASQDRPQEIGRRVEAFYKGLKELGISSGDELQTVSHILFFNPTADELAMDRFQRLHAAFRAAHVFMEQRDYDELAILTFLDHEPRAVAERVVEHRKVMAKLRPNPGRSLSFSFACSTVFLELAKLSPTLESVAEARLLKQLEDVNQAKQAAAVAAST